MMRERAWGPPCDRLSLRSSTRSASPAGPLAPPSRARTARPPGRDRAPLRPGRAPPGRMERVESLRKG
jgi:hypothetical protein